MFTGIVEEMGEVISLQEKEDMELWDGSKGKGTSLTIRADVVLEGAYLGYVVFAVLLLMDCTLYSVPLWCL
jgi:riboflavin synthase alpha subunit